MLAILDKKMSIKRDTTLWTEPQVDAKRELHHCRHLDQENIRPAEDRQLSEREFYVRAKAICRDLFEINAKRYWIDFLLSTTAAYICASIFLASSSASIVGWLAFAAAVVLIYRGSMFIHEIVHLPSNKLKVFRRVWNFYAGVPMLVPTSTYQSHIHHHNSNHYGTDQDGEYLPFAHGTFWGIGVYLCQIVFQPLLVYARYLLWTPLSFMHPRLRNWTLANASSLVINFKYRNDAKPDSQSAEDTFWELFTCFRAWVMIGLVYLSVMPVVRLPKILILAMAVLTINHLRTLAAHRYRSDGEKLSHLEQFRDSTNISGGWITELWCPLGLRYHALHHLFPGIPYHNLATAHRRLVSQLPGNSIYHDSIYPNFLKVFQELVSEIRSQDREHSQVLNQSSSKPIHIEK